MERLLLVTGMLAGFATSVFSASIVLQNVGTDVGGTNGAIYMINGSKFDGINNNLGVTVWAGPTEEELSLLGTFKANNDPKGYTGLDMGTFQLGFPMLGVAVPGVAPGGSALIRLDMWFDGSSSNGIFPSFAAAVEGKGVVGSIKFRNVTGTPPSAAPLLTGMPRYFLGDYWGPVITRWPESQTVTGGETAALTVSAFTVLPHGYLRYQWLVNGASIPSATNNALLLTNVQPCASGAYRVTVGCFDDSTFFGSMTTTAAVLTVRSAPLITGQPQGATGYWGGSASFTVNAQGTAPLVYQWSKGGVVIPWGTNATLTLTNLAFTDAGNYSVSITNLYGTTNSTAASLTVRSAGVGLGLPPFLTITGTVGKTFGVSYATQLSQPSSWIVLTNLTLSSPVEQWIDPSPNAGGAPMRFYRVLPIP